MSDWHEIIKRLDDIERRLSVLESPRRRVARRLPDCGCPPNSLCNNAACPRRLFVTSQEHHKR